MAGFEVGELALHGVDEELDGDIAVAGFLADDLGELGADSLGGALGFGFGLPLGLSLRLRLGAGIAVGCALGGSALGGAGVVDDSLGLIEAELDEESSGVDAVAGLEVGELALHGGDEELDDESAVLGFLGDDVGETGHIFYFRDGGGMRQRGMVTWAVFRFRWFIFMDAQDLQDFECEVRWVIQSPQQEIRDGYAEIAQVRADDSLPPWWGD